MQVQLKVLRDRLEALLQACRHKYAANELLIKQRMTKLVKSAAAPRQDNRTTSTLFYGAPFFKTIDCYSAPYNADYLQRRQRGHLFPIELEERLVAWTTGDKLQLIRAVRQQVVQRLQREHKDWLRRLKPEATAASARARLLDSYSRTLAPKRLVDLMALLVTCHPDEFPVDWYTVAQEHLHDRHKSNECQAIWTGFMRPSLNRAAWTGDEEDRLMRTVASYDQQNWDAIARQMDRRSGFQCLVHFRTKLFDHTQRIGRFTPTEDAVLLRLVQHHRIGKHIPWETVAAGMGGRSRSQAYYRYMFSLRPDIKRDKFSVEEDCILMAAYKQHGAMVEKFMHLLPGRTRVQIRNRYRNVLRHENRPAAWTVESDRQLMELVERHGESNWALIADELGCHTRTSCRSRFVRIRSFLAKNPEAIVDHMARRTVHRVQTVTADNWMDTLIQVKTEQSDEKRHDQEAAAAGALERGPPQLSDYLRYSYGLRMRPLRPPNEPTTGHTQTVCRVLRSQACPVDYKLLHAIPNDTIDMKRLEDDVSPSSASLQLPASRCTALLLRGLAVMFPDAKRTVDGGGEQRPIVERTEALDLFRRRFRALLLNTAMLARVLPQQSEQQRDAALVKGSEIEEGSFTISTSEGAFVVSVVTSKKRGTKRKKTES